MKRLAAFFLVFALCVSNAAAQVDSTRLAQLDARLGQYFSLLEQEPAEVKNQECDALIEAAEDPAIRQAIAQKVYDHYRNSALMGDEAVAIHVTDTWFSTGKAEMRSEMELLDARIFADFNRQSLLGMQAPSLEVFDPQGDTVRIGGPARRYRVLFFYDTDCAKCKMETILLRSKLNTKDYPVDVYAFCTGDDPDEWLEWRTDRFNLRAEATEVIHVWDPEVHSDYQKKYGVLQTPRMFLLDRTGKIVGRGMDTDALEQILDILISREDYTYGGESSNALFDNLFASYGDLDAMDIMETAGLLEQRTLAKGDTLMFKHLEGDLLYYLVPKRDEVHMAGAKPFIDEYILGRPGIWNTADDTLKVVGLARMMGDLLSRTPVGSRIPKISSIKGWNKFRRRGGYLLFHTTGCPVCVLEVEAARISGYRYFEVDMDALSESDPASARKLLDTFDLSGLPLIIETGRRGVVKRKYVSLLE
jgi:peroxiredoxin